MHTFTYTHKRKDSICRYSSILHKNKYFKKSAMLKKSKLQPVQALDKTAQHLLSEYSRWYKHIDK